MFDSRYPPRGIGEVLDFLGMQRAIEDSAVVNQLTIVRRDVRHLRAVRL